MKSSLRLPLFTLLLLCPTLFVACDANEPEEGPLQSIRFSEGSTRLYETFFSTIVTDTDGVVLSTTTETDTFAVFVAPESEEIPGFSDTRQLDLFDPAAPELRDAVWYIQNDSQLVEVAYRNGNSNAPVINLKRSPAFERFITMWRMVDGRIGGTPGEIQVRTDPRVVATFPLDVGARWTSFTDPWLQIREALREESLEVPAGTFDCVVVESSNIIEGNPDSGKLTDHVASTGLVQRVFYREGEARDAQNNIFGTETFESRFRLVSVSR